MSQTRKNLIVGQSGGPTAAINSSLYGVVKEGLRQKETPGGSGSSGGNQTGF